MADTIYARKTRIKGVEASRIFYHGQETTFLFGKGTQIFPNLPVAVYGTSMSRVVTDSGQKWFEFGFMIDTTLTGNSSAGWTDSGNYFKLEPEWSLDLVNWSMGKFVPAPTPVVTVTGGFEYWSRCIHPVDSSTKTGQLSLVSGSGIAGALYDTRNNPFTALTIAGVVRALGGFPYTMPTDAARMQTDLAAIFPGATVVATTDVDWAITIPNVSLTAYTQTNRISWPQYLVADMYGNINTPCNGADFKGTYVNASGVAIYDKAFARLKISGGTRYDPYR